PRSATTASSSASCPPSAPVDATPRISSTRRRQASASGSSRGSGAGRATHTRSTSRSRSASGSSPIPATVLIRFRSVSVSSTPMRASATNTSSTGDRRLEWAPMSAALLGVEPHGLQPVLRELAGGPHPDEDVDRLLLGVDVDPAQQDRKSTRLNSSHVKISYAVFCLKKKKT